MTQNSLAVIAAARDGFRVTEDGIAIRPDGSEQFVFLPTSAKNQYFSFGYSFREKRVHVKVHRLVAYLKFGEAALLPGVHTRHLNGDSKDNRWSNIAIGSQSENMMDKSPVVRSGHAKKAGRARSLPDSIWKEIEDRHNSGMSFKAIRNEYGIALGTLSYRLSKTAKKTVLR